MATAVGGKIRASTCRRIEAAPKPINFLSAECHEQWARHDENPSQSIAILQQSETNLIRICVYLLCLLSAQCPFYLCSSKCKHQLGKGPFRPFNKVPLNAFDSYTIELRTCVYSNRRYEMNFPIESNEWFNPWMSSLSVGLLHMR